MQLVVWQPTRATGCARIVGKVERSSAH